MSNDYIEPMVVDENGNIYFSAKYISENKNKEIEKLYSIINESKEIIRNWEQEYNGLMKTNNIYIPEDKPNLYDLKDVLNK